MSADSVATGSVKASNGGQTHAKTSARRRRDVDEKADRCQAGVEANGRRGSEFTRQAQEKRDSPDTRKFTSDYILNAHLFAKSC